MKLWVKNIKGEHCLVDLEPADNVGLKLTKGARIQEKIVNNVLLKKGAVSLFYDCEAITPEDTVESLKMEPFDVITVFAQSQNPYAPLKADQSSL